MPEYPDITIYVEALEKTPPAKNSPIILNFESGFLFSAESGKKESTPRGGIVITPEKG